MKFLIFIFLVLLSFDIRAEDMSPYAYCMIVNDSKITAKTYENWSDSCQCFSSQMSGIFGEKDFPTENEWNAYMQSLVQNSKKADIVKELSYYCFIERKLDKV